MTNFELIISKAKKWEYEEIKKNKTELFELFSMTNEVGQLLAEKLKADKDIVMLGTLLMDIKLSECIRLNKVGKHIEMSYEASEKFLDKQKISGDAKEKILNCVEAHHRTKEFTCIEAEVCANADCYKFIHPRGVFSYFKLLGKRLDKFDEVLKQVEQKMDEKHKILSLDVCKEELEGYYATFKELFKRARYLD
ncbi:MAG: hypothetical protein KJ583_00690 [Nanoarchaeota archaeon]|nr:hypothetical protein [Nanoarchaeota archaeon]MBU1269966.1 hypothetical protein [Nanoarchaeota archaeon]MBU1603806.1 hypothetical protein [Nanoarchaeota archaeon]MBU2443179.1 hypothetical protein [Nanoarchaeota archaeon]